VIENRPLMQARESFEAGQYRACYDALEHGLKIYPQWAKYLKFSQQQLVKNYPMFDFKKSYPAKVKDVPKFPKNFPDWLTLPPLNGVANDYSFIEKAKNEWKKKSGRNFYMGVSIVIPVYNRSIEVDYVLAGLKHQSYPKELMEVVIADDGSKEDISIVYSKYKKYFSIKYCRQEDKGYRLAEARNMGIKNASYDNIIILDSDAIPNEQLVEKYMEYFHVNRNIAMFGLRYYVSVANLDPDSYAQDKNLILKAEKIQSENTVATTNGETGYSSDWREEHIKKTNGAKSEALPYRFLVGANCAFTREVFDRVDGYCTDFRDWGYEDQEFGYRLQKAGVYFLALEDNYVYHQEPLEGKNDTDRKLGMASTRPIYIEKCPYIYRKTSTKKHGFEAPLVSIYIPLYNRENFIIESIQSALEQSVKDLEVVICDDGSTDKSLELIQKYYSKNNRVKVISQKNGGIGAASNTAVKNCKGYYIGQLDADDVLMSDAVEKCLHEMEKDSSLSLVYGTTEYIDQKSKFISDGWNWPTFSREYLLSNMIVHHFRFFRQRDFARTTGFDETIRNAVDYDMMLKLAEVGNVKHLNQVLYQYRRHDEMTTVMHNNDQHINHFIAINNALSRMGAGDVKAIIDPEDIKSKKVLFCKS
jgi:chondroitin synthase